MNASPTLDEVEKLIKEAKTAKDLFGDDPKKSHHILMMATHPDRNLGIKKAEDLFREISRLWDSLSVEPVIIKSKKHSYSLLNIIGVGDIADVHLAEATKDGAKREYLLKISRIVHSDKLLDNEQKVIKDLLTKAGDTTYRKYLPVFVESFTATDVIQKRINVYLYEGKAHTAENLHEKIPAIESRHLAWMFKRILTILGFAHKSGYVHGAVLPSHVLFKEMSDSPELDHGVVLTSWSHAVSLSDTIKTISAKYKDWYPPEVFDKKPTTPGTDIYMAAKTIMHLAGDKPIPVPMQRFFQSCLLPGAKMRPNDAWELHTEFDELLKSLYGKPKFHKFLIG